MFEGFVCGIVARVLKVIAFLFLIRWVFDGFSWGWGIPTLLLIVGASWFKYLNTQTVRVRP